MSGTRVCIFGAKGCLGAEFIDVLPTFGIDVCGADLPEVDITNPEQVRSCLREARADAVINAAAYTAVDRAETESDAAFHVNEWGAEVVAKEARAADAVHVFFSTDFVFDGERSGPPYTEEDVPNPRGVYARSKLAGERAVLTVHPGSAVLRIGGLYGRHGKNFFSTLPGRIREGHKTLLDTERKVGPTWSRCVVAQACELIRQKASGLFHATCQGQTTWAEFGAEICWYFGVEETFERVGSDRLALAAPRPRFAVLDNRRLRLSGMDRMPFWRDALRSFLDSQKSRPK